ncbi:hypothetical protein R5W23_005638 [Gemmata sp. JC673]|uniref:Uncharacterized protein n=1 Tax=Gemmata algarum TaxID=2975278 RepID=A0ABU5EU68_9BACT|nr:hypothetical protein [Gemmata algarum]MDY3558518.1 hypothetical protein [Gemmata algarum]
MVLARVYYELFSHEAEWLDAHSGADAELGRQLRLEMTDGSRVFIAWAWGADGDGYHVEFAPHSFCAGAPEVDRDVSAWPLWSPLVGQPVTLSYVGEGQQVLAIRAAGAAAYCCSFGRGVWGMDELRVGDRPPQHDREPARGT